LRHARGFRFGSRFRRTVKYSRKARVSPAAGRLPTPATTKKRFLFGALRPLRVSVAHYENFPVASFLVPRALRPAVVAIYRFARMADDLADEGDATPAARIAALDGCERALDAIVAGTPPAAPPYPELAAAIARHALPVAPLRDLLCAFRQDVTTTRYATHAALADYCRRSADPIGRLLLHLYGAATAENLACADAICSGLQQVNFWQDVAVDWAKGRVYVPQEDLARFGVTEAQIAAGRADAAWRALLAFETGRTRALLESGRPLADRRRLPWRLALELSGVLAGGHRILDAIDAVGGDVFRRRPRLARGDWARVAVAALFPPRRPRAAA
jgi:squalene synthase HpnC